MFNFITSENFRKYIQLNSGIEGSEYVEFSEIQQDRGIIRYFRDYDSFSNQKPNLNISKEKFELFFDDRPHAEKILLREPIKLLKILPSLSEIEVTLWHKKIKHVSAISQKESEKIFGIKYNEIMKNRAKWIKFVDNYIENDKNRAKYLEYFIKRYE